jgi:hypothetical protein
MHPLNGPGWSFMNILAIYFMHYLCGNFQNSTFHTSLSGCALIHLAVTSPTGDGGWALDSLFTLDCRDCFSILWWNTTHRVVNLTTIKTHLFGQVFCLLSLLAMNRK